MGQRLELHQLLKSFTEHVYFQPPDNIQIQYPCIIYNRDSVDTRFADDIPYNHSTRYSVMVIDRSPDSVIPSKVASMPMSSFNRFFIADELNHDVYTVYY